ncbi:hypothetical protein CAEBREN_16461 [Caenorhabditis brenneri]|uniref:Uncharacterized protein n=1 Tax=Caenorhabditis brenneri TaxID=135651 RepID=G0NBQ6_CAEBE|nr:hypothetical protein CAEBREN_16461 [Caenorhabditis brenneri]
MKKLIILMALTAHFSQLSDASSMPVEITGMGVFEGETVSMLLPQTATYRRTVKNAKRKEIEHLYRVCNGKNKKTCGYWENTNTKKKVASGTTTYNKNKHQLIIKKVKKTDAGVYTTGNKMNAFEVYVFA